MYITSVFLCWQYLCILFDLSVHRKKGQWAVIIFCCMKVVAEWHQEVLKQHLIITFAPMFPLPTICLKKIQISLRLSWGKDLSYSLLTIIRDYRNTGIYCRKMLGKEVYFQPTSAHSYEKFMKHIERTVQKSLKMDYNQEFFWVQYHRNVD